MLKIKADRMKDLEKFGFELIIKFLSKEKQYYYRSLYTYSVEIMLITREIKARNRADALDACYIWSSEERTTIKNMIQDLIQADMVEEVTE